MKRVLVWDFQGGAHLEIPVRFCLMLLWLQLCKDCLYLTELLVLLVLLMVWTLL